MTKIINALGKPCPMPVILAKKEIDAKEGSFLIQVDNQAAVENLKRLADASGYSSRIQETGGNYEITFSQACEACEAVLTQARQPSANGNYAVFVGKEWIGDGDHELGRNLMRMFFYTLTQSGDLPAAILFMNGGVKLPSLDDEIPGHLQQLKECGVELLVCGTCLDFFGIKEKLQVGQISNMYDITEKMQQAGKVITL